MKNANKMHQLIALLKARNNNSYKFFEKLLSEFEEDSRSANEQLQSCFAITQYADFTTEEENLLSEVIEANSE